jgi:hypothetical protein
LAEGSSGIGVRKAIIVFFAGAFVAACADTNSGPRPEPSAVLLEEDNSPQGSRYDGTTVWQTDTATPGPGLAAEPVITAHVAIPERQINASWSLRRNTDRRLPASHVVEIKFDLPANFLAWRRRHRTWNADERISV